MYTWKLICKFTSALLTLRFDRGAKLNDIYKIQGRVAYFEKLRNKIDHASKFKEQKKLFTHN